MNAGIVRENVLAVQAQRRAETELDVVKAENKELRKENAELRKLVKEYRAEHNERYSTHCRAEHASNRRIWEFMCQTSFAAFVALCIYGAWVLIWNVFMACWFGM